MEKHGNVIVHELKGGILKEGETVSCVVDSQRRDGITKNHTSTHILNASSRDVLGSWVWQNSAFKEADHARLDITHHSALTDEEVAKIEKKANSIVQKNLPVKIENFDRGTAEQKYGFRIYQGGVVPVKSVRIVSIKDFDVEACGGTHVKKTREIELIKITKTKRIQDGVVRIEFVSGKTAQDYVTQHENEQEKMKEEQAAKEEKDKLREERKEQAREKIPGMVNEILEKNNVSFTMDAILVKKPDVTGIVVYDNDYDEYFHVNFGEKLIKNDPKAVYCGIFEDGDTIRALVYSGNEAQKTKNAGTIAKEISIILGGSGGGNARFAQGGGKDKSKKDEAIKRAKSMVLD